MRTRKWITVLGVVVLVAVLGLTVAGTALAQDSTPEGTTPEDQVTPAAPRLRLWGRGFGFGGGETAAFDKVAEALNLTPTQLFEQLHSGKTIEEIATAQGIDLEEIQAALTAQRTQSMKDAIEQAVTDGKITREQADWLLEGLDKGYMNKGFEFGRGGFGMPGMRGHDRMRGFGGMRGFDKGDTVPSTPDAPAPGTSS